MADASYQPKVYRRQGGNVQVIASGGQQLVESGASVTYETGAVVQIPVVLETTTAALANSGISTVTRGTTATGANNYTMAAPVAGCTKFINVLAAATSECVTISGNTNVGFGGGTGTPTTLKIIREGGVQLIGISTSAWQIVGGSTVYAFATS